MRFVVMTLISMLLSPLCTFAQSLSSGSGTYHINYQGKDAGIANYTIAAAPNGYAVTARGSARLGTIELAFSKDETLDAKLEILSEALNGTVNGQAVFVTVKADGAKFQVDTSASGNRLSNALDRHPHTVFTPTFDPSALLLVLRHAARSPELWALVPQQSGLLFRATLNSKQDEKGTLNGSPIAVRHSTLTMADVTSEVFSSNDGLLLQQETPTQGLSMVLDGFVLAPPKAAAPQPAASPADPAAVPDVSPPAAIQ